MISRLPFPFSVRFKRSLKVKLSPSELKRVMGFVQFYLENRTADDVIVEGDKLTFKVRFFKFRLNINIMASIDGGEVVLEDKGFVSELQYKILLARLFVITAIISIIAFLVTQSLFPALMVFLFFCGVNWIAAVVRHNLMLINIANGIEVLLNNPWKSEQLEDKLYYQIIDGEAINS